MHAERADYFGLIAFGEEAGVDVDAPFDAVVADYVEAVDDT